MALFYLMQSPFLVALPILFTSFNSYQFPFGVPEIKLGKKQ